MFKALILVVFSLGLLIDSCGPPQPEVYLDKTSPSGVYRVKVRVWQQRVKGGLDYRDHLRVQYFKGQQLIYTEETQDEDQYESSIRESAQVVEWVGDNVLRMGRDRSDQPFSDQLIISNNTDEPIRYLGVSYGKYQTFRAFDVLSGSQLMLQASPEFKPDGSSNYFLGYSGKTESGRSFEGTVENKQRKSPADGAIKFRITVNGEDLH